MSKDLSELLDNIDLDFKLESSVKKNSNITDVLNNLKYVSKKIESLNITANNYNDKLIDIEHKISELNDQQLIIKESQVYFQRAIDILYEKSVGELENVINLALQFIFYDIDYKIKIELTDKRGKSLDFYILKSDGNLEDVINGVGKSVRTVISFILHIYFLINKGAYPILFLDEQFTGMSNEYVQNFMDFVKSFCKEKNFIIILISHDERFINYADNTFIVSSGNVTKLPNVK